MLVPQTWLCIEITAYHNCVSQFVFHLQGNPNLPLWCRWKRGCMHWWESGICVSHRVFLSGCPAICLSLGDHLSKLSKDTVLLRLLRTTIAIPRPSCLWMTEALVVDLGMSLFLVDIPHQSRRPSSPGQRLVCWNLHNSMSILWSASWTACLLFSFYAFGRRVLICVFRLSFTVSVGLGLGILIDVSSPAHDPHCAGEILFLYWYPCEVVLLLFWGFFCFVFFFGGGGLFWSFFVCLLFFVVVCLFLLLFLYWGK